jgi:transcriptional regulator GlxA family with amidase domain
MPMRDAQRYQDIVARFEKAARDAMDSPVSIHSFCRTAAINQRTLLRAMRAIHGTTPSHHVRALRLAEARQTLLCMDPPASSVTEVALRFGFRELGRFAVDYRMKFGESPSDTLRRTTADLPA